MYNWYFYRTRQLLSRYIPIKYIIYTYQQLLPHITALFLARDRDRGAGVTRVSYTQSFEYLFLHRAL